MNDTSSASPGDHSPKPGGLRIGLSGKLLLLTTLFVMVAEVMIYVPSIANFRIMWLKDRLAAAHTAALVLDAAPSGMVPESLADADPRQRRRQGGGDEDRPAAPAAGEPNFTRRPTSTRTSTCATCRPGRRSSTRSRRCWISRDSDILRAVGPAPRGGEFVEIVIEEGPLRDAMWRYSRNILSCRWRSRSSPPRSSISRCITCSCGR